MGTGAAAVRSGMDQRLGEAGDREDAAEVQGGLQEHQQQEEKELQGTSSRRK
jgi:hypothetical protein